MPKGVIAIVGTTGVGKSDLGIQLAKTLGGEIINGDSMQVYKGLDIITNKTPMSEREGVPHHLINFLEPHLEYRVTEFTKDALKIIKEIHKRDKIPIIVGGTHYYIQSLLWKNSLIGNGSICDESDSDDALEFKEVLDVETDVLYKRLQEVDPVMANRWHWNDRRKIRRSLQIYLQTGKPHSEWIKEQHQPGEKASSLRFPLTCIFWLYADPGVLDKRLDARVDKMIERGLFDEINYLRNEVKNGKIRVPLDQDTEFTRGIWQAIGYKEFEPYLKALEETSSSDSDNLNDSLRASGIERMKIVTRRYARHQIRWIRNRLLLKYQQTIQENANGTDADCIKVYLLNATSLETWGHDVRDKAISIVEEYMKTGNGPDPSSINPEFAELLKPTRDTDTFGSLTTWTKYQCDLCSLFNDNSPVIINGLYSWNQHLKSKWHKSNAKWKKEIDEKWDGKFPPWFRARKKTSNVTSENANGI
ncbi:1087_t:CDS:10 [Acaulospora morrowiae]|uniref:tRNA dimethylallyltransferase n=1 Tax=Acaulospora morrowiae TaxID=94023 RepID=A0A9N9E615_9GLOM|nr:1087_t:CDS:10 [Acaulospora morrowiae]